MRSSSTIVHALYLLPSYLSSSIPLLPLPNMSTYTPPPYDLLPIEQNAQSPPKTDSHNPSPIITNLLTLAKPIQTEVTEPTFTSWRDQLTTTLDTLVEHTHLLKPADLLSLLQDGIAAPLQCIKGLTTDKTSLCFPDRCQRISELASGLAAYLRQELREGNIALAEPGTSEDPYSYSERGVLSLVKAWFSASMPGVSRSDNGQLDPVRIHPALTVTLSMLAAAIGHLSVRDERNAFTHTMKEVDVSGWKEYSTDDDGYLGAFWKRVLPGKEDREGCGCSRCRSYLMMLVGWRLSSGKYGVLHTPFF